MNPEPLLVLGTMSGTSCDGFDLALCRIGPDPSAVELVAFVSRDYPPALRDRLRAISGCALTAAADVESEWTDWATEVIREALVEWQRHGQPVLLGFSGHTLFHEPGGRGTHALGDARRLSRTLDLPVVADYRSADVAAGGQGAPLVPLFDAHVFAQYAACLNLGGIANLTLLPPAAEAVAAWDVTGCNLLLNRQAARLDLAFDPEGRNARDGQVDTAALALLQSWPHLQRNPPKSLSAEDLQPLHTALDAIAAPADALATAAEWIAWGIGQSLSFAKQEGVLLLSGGGAMNTDLVARVGHQLPRGWTLQLPDQMWIQGKEAAAFAWLALRTAQGRTTSLASVTGAESDVCGGRLFGNFALPGNGSGASDTPR